MAYNQQNQSGALCNSLTSGSKIIGTVVANNDIRIDGIIEGDVQCSGKVVIGEKGWVKGNITCANAELFGRLEGKIEVSQMLTLHATAQMIGDVITTSLSVEPNAVFNGTCQMSKSAAPAVK